MINADLEKSLFEKNYNSIVGFDEAGRGPLAGPIVCGYVFLDQKSLDENSDLLELVNDSKKLSEKKRKTLSEEIKKRFRCGVSVLDNKQIDKLGIQRANVKIVENIIKKYKTDIDYVIMDYIGGFKNYFKDDFKKFECIVDGDAKHFVIAMASIIAKVYRDEYMESISEKYPQYNFSKHKGYGTKAHIESIKKFGMCDIHRRGFIHFVK